MGLPTLCAAGATYDPDKTHFADEATPRFKGPIDVTILKNS